MTDSVGLAILATQPLGYWPLDEGAGATQLRDESGNGLHATVGGTLNFQDPNLAGSLDASGKSIYNAGSGVASENNAVSGWGQVNYSTNPKVDLVGSFTIAGWVQRQGTPSVSGGILERYQNPGSNGYILRFDTGGNIRGFSIAGSTLYQVFTPFTTGVARFVALVMDTKAGTLGLYVTDMVTPAHSIAAAGPTSGIADMKLFARGDDAMARMSGNLQHAAIWNRALSQAERVAIAGANRFTSARSLLRY